MVKLKLPISADQVTYVLRFNQTKNINLLARLIKYDFKVFIEIPGTVKAYILYSVRALLKSVVRGLSSKINNERFGRKKRDDVTTSEMFIRELQICLKAKALRISTKITSAKGVASFSHINLTIIAILCVFFFDETYGTNKINQALVFANQNYTVVAGRFVDD